MSVPRPSRRRLLALLVAVFATVGLIGPSAATALETVQLWPSSQDRYFSPNGDGFEDVLSTEVEPDREVDYTLTVTPSGGGAAVWSTTGSSSVQSRNGYLTNVIGISWDGRTTGGTPAPAGGYDVTVDATAPDGSATGRIVLQTGIDRSAKPTVTIDAPAAGTTLHSGDPVQLSWSGADVPNDVELRQVTTGTLLGQRYVDSATGTVSIDVEPGNVPNGNVDTEGVVSWVDPLGSLHETTSAPRAFVATSTPSLVTTSTPVYVYPDLVTATFNGIPNYDEAWLSFRLGQAATVTTTVRDAQGAVVRTIDDGTPETAGGFGVQFNGRTGPQDSDPKLPDGLYTVRVVATFATGGPLQAEVQVGVSHLVPTVSITAPAAGTVHGPTPATVSVSGGLTLTSASLVDPDGTGWYGNASVASDQAQPSLDVTLDPTGRPDGPLPVMARGIEIDPLGGYHYLDSAPVAYTLEYLLEITGDTATATLAPDGTPATEKVTTTYTLSSDATISTTVRDSSDTVVATLTDQQQQWAGSPQSVDWYGTDDNGAPVENGDYTLVVHGVTGTGKEAELRRTITLSRPDAGQLTTTTTTSPVTGDLPLSFTPADGTPTPSYVDVYDPSYSSYSAVGSLSQQYDDNGNLTGPFVGTISTPQYDNGPHALYGKVHYPDGSVRQTPRLSLAYGNPVAFLYPPSDGTVHPDDAERDRVSLSAYTNQPAKVTVDVTDADGNPVRSFTEPTADRNHNNLYWDGRTSSGARAANGTYTVTLTANEAVLPSTTSATATVTVVPDDVGTLTSPAAGATVGGTTHLVYTPDADGTYATVVSFYARQHSDAQYRQTTYLGSGTKQDDGTWTLDADLSPLSDGAYDVFADVSWYNADPYKSGDAGTPAVPVTVKQPGAITSTSGSRYFSPDGDGYEDQASVSYTLSRAADVDVTVTKADGTPLGVSSTDTSEFVGTHSFTWDGTVNGTTAPPGRYLVKLHATNPANPADTADEQVEIGIGGAPGALTGPGSGGFSPDPAVFTWTPTPSDTATAVILWADQSTYVQNGTVGDSGLTSFSVDLKRQVISTSCYGGTCTPVYRAWPNGPHTFYAEVDWTDPLGATHHSYRSPGQGIVVANPLSVTAAPARGFVGLTDSSQPVSTFAGTYSADQPTSLTAEVHRASDDALVRTLPAPPDTSYDHTVGWDGTTDAGTDAPDGAYTLRVVLTEPFAQLQQAQTTPIEVRRASPGSFTYPELGVPVSGNARFEYTAASGVTFSNVDFTDTSGYLLAHATESSPGVWTAATDATYNLTDGTNTIHAVGHWADAATPAGKTNPWRDSTIVTVDNGAYVDDIPDATYFTPNGDGIEDTYVGKYRTNSAGLKTYQWVNDATDTQLVRTLANGELLSVGQFGSTCSPRTRTIIVGESSTTEHYYVCDRISWDGTDNDHHDVPNGTYTLHVKVENASGQTSEKTTTIGVERRMPVTDDIPSTVADTLPITYTQDPGFTSGSATGIKVGVQSVLAQQTAQVGDTPGTWHASFDLPTSLPDALTFETDATWLDQWGNAHHTVKRSPTTVDTTTFDLAFSSTAPQGYDPHPQSFVLDAPAAAPTGWHWSIDTGVPDATPLTGDVDAGTRHVEVPYTYPKYGSYKATAAITDSNAVRRHDTIPITIGATPPAKPVVTLSVTPERALAPVAATATLSATVTDDSTLTYVVDWGDSTTSSTGSLPLGEALTHTYENPGTYTPVAKVTAHQPDRSVTSEGNASARVVAGKAEPLAARIVDGSSKVTTINGAPVSFDAGGSSGTFDVPDSDIAWDFGDGSGDNGAVVDHPYDEPGTYLVTLTITRDGTTSTDTQTVVVLDKATTSVSTVTVTSKDGAPIADAQLVRNVGTDSIRAKTGPDGTATVYGLPEGASQLDAWADGFQPGVADVTVTDNVGTGTAQLASGPLADVSLTTARITDVDALKAFGVDTTDAANHTYVEYDVALHYSSDPADPPLRLRGVYDDAGQAGFPTFIDPTDPTNQFGQQCVQKGADGLPHQIPCASGGPIPGGFTPEVKDVGNGQKALIVLFSPKTGVLKEFYNVQASVQLLAAQDSTATLDDVTATLTYDKTGLALPALNGKAQSDVVTLPEPVTATKAQTFQWVMRGEQAGSWDVDVDISSVLQPFGQHVTLSPEKPAVVKVYGNNAYRLVVQAPEQVTKNVPTKIRMGIENLTTDLPLLGATVQVLKNDNQFVFQPDPATGLPVTEPQEFKDPIQPKTTVFKDFPIIPTFTGPFDVASSTITRTKGVEQSGTTPTDLVQVLDPDPDDVANPPTLDVTAADNGQDAVTWSPVKNASKYYVYVADSLTQTGGFGKPVAEVTGTSATITVPDSYSEATDTAALRRFSMNRVAALGFDPAAAAKKIIVQSVVNGLNQLRHPVKDAFASCGGGVDGTFGSWDLKGCLNQQVDGWLAVVKPGEMVKLNGLVIQPAGSTTLKVKMTTADGTSKGALTADASVVKVGFDAGPTLGVIPIYQGPLKWNLNGPIAFNATAKDVLGLRLTGGLTVTTDGEGAVKVAANVESPAVLGGASGATSFHLDNTNGLQVDGLTVKFAKGSLAGVDYAATLDYDGTVGRAWKVSGNATQPGGVVTAVTGALSYAADGSLTKGELHAKNLQLFGLMKVPSFDLTTAGGTSWTGALTTTLADGSSAALTATYVVDPAKNAVTSATLTAKKAVLKGLVTVDDLALTYAGDATHVWTAAGKVTTTRAGAPTTTFAATYTTTAEGVVKDGALDVRTLPFAGFAMLNQLALSYTAATQTYTGSVDISTPGAVKAGTGTFTIVGQKLQSLHVTLTDARIGGLVRISTGTLDYDQDTATIALSATKADLANLVGLTDLTASKVGNTFTLNGSGPDASGKTVTVASSMTYVDGGLTQGTMALSGLSFGGLVPINAVSLAYTPAGGWAVSGDGGEGNPSFAITVKDGVVESASVDVPKAKLGGVADVAFHAKYVGADDLWSAGAEVTLPTGKTANDFALDMTYEKGEFTAGKISGTLGLKGGLVVKIGEISYTKADDTWVGDADIVMPGPAGSSVGGSLKIAHGAFVSGAIRANNLSVPLGSGIFLTDADLSVALEPEVKLSGTLGLAAGPAGLQPVKVTSTVAVTVRNDGSALYSVDGQLFLVGNELAAAGLSWDTLGIASFHGHLGYGIAPIARIDADLKATIDANGFKALTTAQLQLFNHALTGQALVDQNGATACAQWPDTNVSVGFTYTWGGSPSLIGDSCGIAGFSPTSSPSAALRRAGSLRALAVAPGPVSFTVPAGQPVYALKLVGASAAPEATLTRPDGTTLDTTGVDGTDSTNQLLVLRDDANLTTYVLLIHPTAGAWTAAVTSGGLASSAVAPAAPAPVVQTTVTGTGDTRTLTYNVTTQPGQTVSFVEQLPDGSTRLLGTATGDTGTLTFAPSGDGTRKVFAIVESGGVLQTAVQTASYDPATTTDPGSGGGGSGGGGGTGGGGSDPGTGGGTTPSPTPSPSTSTSPTPSPSPSPSGSPSPTPAAPGALFHPLVPARVYDARLKDGAIHAGADRLVKVTGAGGVPAGGVSAVVVNVTGLGASLPADLQVYPAGAKPGRRTSNLNLLPGDVHANLVTVPVGKDGAIALSLGQGHAYAVVDVVGWYDDGTQAGGDTFRSVVPSRVYDSRTSTPVKAGQDRDVTVTGVGGIPSSGVDAVVVNTTVLGNPLPADLGLYPTGARPSGPTSTINLAAREVRANLAVVKVGKDGRISAHLSQGSAQLVLDVVGWYGAPTAADPGLRFHAVTPTRAYDSRSPADPLLAQRPRTVSFGQLVPAQARAVVTNVTVVDATHASDVRLYPAGSRPGTDVSNVNVTGRLAVPNLAVVGLGTGQAVTVVSSGGSLHTVLDLAGWFGP